jgi:hypothetical protein
LVRNNSFLASQSLIIRSSGDWLSLKLLMMGDSEVKERVMLGWIGFVRGGGGM